MPKEFGWPLFFPWVLVRVDRKVLKWANVSLDNTKGQLLSSAPMLWKHLNAYFFWADMFLHSLNYLMNHGSKRQSLSLAVSKQYNAKWVFWRA
jgi:hypothetical protein